MRYNGTIRVASIAAAASFLTKISTPVHAAGYTALQEVVNSVVERVLKKQYPSKHPWSLHGLINYTTCVGIGSYFLGIQGVALAILVSSFGYHLNNFLSNHVKI
jgi:hypothetical protein